MIKLFCLIYSDFAQSYKIQILFGHCGVIE